MRVGYLVSQYPAINHTFILREIRELRGLGFDVLAVSVRRPDRAVAEMSPEEADEARRSPAILGLSAGAIAGIHLRTLLRSPAGYARGLVSALRLGRLAPRYLAYFAEAVVAGHLFRAAGIDHVHVHFSSTVALIAARIFPLGMSITFHGPVEFAEPAAFHLREKIEASVFVRGISRFGASQTMLATDYANWPRIEMVRLGVDGAAFHPPGARERMDGAPAELLCVGRLADVKGQHILIDAVAELIGRGHAARLRLVGDGPDRKALTEHAARLGIADSVIFEGWAGQDRIRRFYEQADLFVMASFAEGIPVVLMEAMATELPVIATWVNGVPELVEHGVNGLLCPAGDTGALVDCMVTAMGDAALRRRLGAAGRATVLRKYDLAANARAWAAVLERRLRS